MKKKIGFVIVLLIAAIAIMIAYILNVKGVANKNDTLPKEMIGSWSSNSNEINVYDDGTVYWSQFVQNEDGKEKLSHGYAGRADGYHFIFTQYCDLVGNINDCDLVENISEDDLEDISEVYTVQMQGSTAFVLNNASANKDVSIAFVKTKNHIDKNLSSKTEIEYQMMAYYELNLTQDELDNLQKQIENIEGVKSVELINAEQAWQEYKEIYWKDDPDAAETFKGDNPLAASGHFSIVYNKKYKDSICKILREYKGISNVVSN